MQKVNNKLIIRSANAGDAAVILALIKELAVYEHAAHEVTNTKEMILNDGFSDNPIFGCLLAEMDGEIVGASIFYYRYSTWKGKRLYLEDLIVKEVYRRRGIGKSLFDATIQRAHETNCSGMMWQVLDWNQSAIDFYTKHYQPQYDNGWINCHLHF